MRLNVSIARDADQSAWQAICEWPQRSGGDFIFYGLDFTHLTRWFLWDKVGRAIRYSTGSQAETFERSIFQNSDLYGNVLRENNRFPHFCRLGNKLRKAFKYTNVNSQLQVPESAFKRKKGKLLYAPIISERLKRASTDLAASGFCSLVAKSNTAGVPCVDLFDLSLNCAADYDVAACVQKGIEAGLKKFGITLLDQDSLLLSKQLLNLTAQVKTIRREFEIILPNALLVHADNHPPYQVYVMEARRLGIPSIMLQHGLDCEHFYLNEAYATDIAVWGPERKRRYHEKSIWQPNVVVTGNPEYEHLHLPTEISSEGDFWLWLTRPHTSEKCYAPSRQPQEGLQILESLIDAFRVHPEVSLVVKPHPYDYREIYERYIEHGGVKGRVFVSDKPTMELIQGAKVVISEDSTAGMEAMFWGKPLIHVHLSCSPPTMPFVDYGAALPAFSAEQLVDSIEVASNLSFSQKQDLLAGQVTFLSDFAGPCDGQAGKKVVEMISSIMVAHRQDFPHKTDIL